MPTFTSAPSAPQVLRRYSAAARNSGTLPVESENDKVIVFAVLPLPLVFWRMPFGPGFHPAAASASLALSSLLWGVEVADVMVLVGRTLGGKGPVSGEPYPCSTAFTSSWRSTASLRALRAV